MDQESSEIELVYVCVCEGGVGRFGFTYTPLTHGFILLYSIFYFPYSIFYISIFGGAMVQINPPPSFLLHFSERS